MWENLLGRNASVIGSSNYGEIINFILGLLTADFCTEDSSLRIYFLSIFLSIAFYSTSSAQKVGNAPSTPAPVGTTVADIIECGEGYTSHELYDMKIVVTQVLRGEEAWKRIQAAASSNKPAAPGFEYILARVKFEYHAREIQGKCAHPLAPEQFAAYSAGGEGYKPASVAPPKPEMRKNLKSGDSLEGWVVFAVAKEDRTPLMSFSVDAGGAVEHGEPKWFSLR
jgi:hypothetical protein